MVCDACHQPDHGAPDHANAQRVPCPPGALSAWSTVAAPEPRCLPRARLPLCLTLLVQLKMSEPPDASVPDGLKNDVAGPFGSPDREAHHGRS